MATRLLKCHREKICSYLNNIILSPDTKYAMDEARYKLTELVNKWISVQFPQDEMRILQKYGVAIECMKIYFEHDTDNLGWRNCRADLLFEFADNPVLPVLLAPEHPYRTTNTYRFHKENPNDEIISAYVRMEQRNVEHMEAEKNLRRAYKQITHTIKSIEELVGIWPEAAVALEWPDPIAIQEDDAKTIIHKNLIARGIVPENSQ